MLIYDSLSGQKKEFQPITPGQVKMYVCGQTVYDDCHIGHARSMIVFDLIVRYFQYKQFKVTFVRNITDVDDKIIQRANENKETCDALTARFIHSMHEDQIALNLLSPDVEPRATEFIQPIIILIEKLLSEKIAYIAGNGDICFSVKKFKDYGKLSKRDVEKLIAGARVDINEGKQDPLDFVLWKLSKPNEPQWDSPWGKGRPGWHIECSAMAEQILGQPFDIHGGGMDLKFPHHENEIAQSEAANHKTFARYWMHVGLLNVNNEKMSKSLKNFFTIKEVLAEYSVEAIRYFMLSAHYRSPVNYSKDNLLLAHQALVRLYTALRGLDLSDAALHDRSFEEKFSQAMDDDFNSPVALSVLFDMTHEINRLRQENKLAEASLLGAQLKKWGVVFGILQTDPEIFLRGDSDHAFSEKVEALIADRNAARHTKNWNEADRIRTLLTEMNVVIEDGGDGTTWRRA